MGIFIALIKAARAAATGIPTQQAALGRSQAAIRLTRK